MIARANDRVKESNQFTKERQSVLLKDCLIIELTITEGLTMTVLKVLRSAKTWKGVIYCSKL